MARLHPRIITFTESESADVAEYRLRIMPDGVPFDYDAPYDVVVSGDNIADLGHVPTVFGTYDVYITSADTVGNEGDPNETPDVVFDFSAPLPPTGVAIS